MRVRGILVVVAFVLLSSCSASEPDDTPQAADASAAASNSPSPSPTETSSPTPEPDKDKDGVPDAYDDYPKNPLASEPEEITVRCDVQGGRRVFTFDRVKPDFTKVWRTSLPEGRGMFNSVYCESYGPKLTPVSQVEQAIWDGDKKPSRYTLRIPYEQCVEHGTKWTEAEWPVSQNQVEEAETALLLCPRHPDAAAIRTRVLELAELKSDSQQGTAFSDGNFRVGSRIQPGTYVTTKVENCYWERLDATGNIIDNNFVSNGLRVEVSILPTDYSFHSQGCGTWRRP